MKTLLKELSTTLLFTLVMVVLCCLVYPVAVWGIAQIVFPVKANGSLLAKDGTFTASQDEAVGSALLGQAFSAAQYFHPRPSAAGSGYDAANSGGTNLGPLSDKLINGLLADAPAPPPATAPATAASASGPVTTAAPAKVLSFDGVRLRVIHYCLDNGIDFKLYDVAYDDNGDIIPGAKKELTAAEKLKFIAADGTVDDVALVGAFPHMDMSPKTDPDTKKSVARHAIIADGFSVLVPADAVTASGSGLDPHISPENAALQVARVAKARAMSADSVKALVDKYTDRPNLGILGDPGVNVLMLNIALDQAAPMKPATAPGSAPATTPATSSTEPAT